MKATNSLTQNNSIRFELQADTIFDTWSCLTKCNNKLKTIDGTRIENLTWRLMFKSKGLNTPEASHNLNLALQRLRHNNLEHENRQKSIEISYDDLNLEQDFLDYTTIESEEQFDPVCFSKQECKFVPKQSLLVSLRNSATSSTISSMTSTMATSTCSESTTINEPGFLKNEMSESLKKALEIERRNGKSSRLLKDK